MDGQPTEKQVSQTGIRDFLSLERNVSVASGAVFLLGFGEELWKKFLPKYLEALGASIPVIGLFGTAEDLLDAVYQYPGGWIADRFGRRRAFFLFLGLACVGYLVYLLGPSWPFVFVGLAFAMAWQSMASPAIFAVIGDSLPSEKRAMGFSIQSILKRVPIVIAPVIGGVVIASRGIVSGVRLGLIITLVIASLTALILSFINVSHAANQAINIFGVWRSLERGLKRLLISDIFIRTSESMTNVLIILYVTNVVHISVARFGTLLAILFSTSLLVYLPAAKAADRVGRTPFIIATFCAFALYPLAILSARDFTGLVIAFIIGGLREIGEPARKAMILDFAQPGLLARSVGLYYLLRSLAIIPAAAIGGLLWKLTPQTPFFVAGAFGVAGTFIFIARVGRRSQSSSAV
ncbi:MAG TPA: MFS transporter [Pyrinomonadaceae bacterium]|nr:MFS transporter [Pyrinomonadaceae bacterium]